MEVKGDRLRGKKGESKGRGEGGGGGVNRKCEVCP